MISGRWKTLLAMAAVAAVLVAVIGAFIGFAVGRLLPHSRPGRASGFDTSTVVNQVQSLAQLNSVKYVMEKVIVLEDVSWLGGQRLIMVAHGIAKAGFDLTKFSRENVRFQGQSLTLTLPKPQITEVFLDDRKTEVIEHSTGLLRQFDKDLQQDARRQAVDKIKIAAVDAGILKDAGERLRQQIAVTAAAFGYTNVIVEFK